jgi:hypothetical protein
VAAGPPLGAHRGTVRVLQGEERDGEHADVSRKVEFDASDAEVGGVGRRIAAQAKVPLREAGVRWDGRFQSGPDTTK